MWQRVSVIQLGDTSVGGMWDVFFTENKYVAVRRDKGMTCEFSFLPSRGDLLWVVIDRITSDFNFLII